MLRSDPLVIAASWALGLAIIIGAILVALWLRRRDRRAQEAATAFLPVQVRGNKVTVAEYMLFRAYIPEVHRDVVRRKLNMREERTFERLAPGDVRQLQEILEAAYVAWIEDGRPA